MWYLLYNILLVVSSPVIVLILLLKKRCRRGLRQRMGMRLPEGISCRNHVLWIHAVSMGEVLAVVPLVRAIHDLYPGFTILISTITETGREAVEQRLTGLAHHCYLPIDWPWSVRRFVSHVQPKAFLVVETELWPNLLKALHAQGVSSILVNGRLSTRSFQRYRWLKSFMNMVLPLLSLCLMQSERDRERVIALGAYPEKVYRTGNMKFDVTVMGLDSDANKMAPECIGLHAQERLIVAGSTHPKEEEILLSCYHEVLKAHPEVVLLMAPRHIERSEQLIETIQSLGFSWARRSQFATNKNSPTREKGPRVIVLDSRGELAQVYALAQVTFVGGTFVPVGGHNLLEPASWGKPVLFGPFTDHCQEIADLLLERGGGRQVRDGREMASVIGGVLNDQELAARMGKAARDVVLENQGVVKRNMEMLRPFLEPHV